MTDDWYFGPLNPGATLREPIANAFFASDAVSEPGAALVREGIQNSLDATPTGERTFVRIRMVAGDDSLSSDEVSRYLVGADEHYRADGCGLRAEDLPADDDAVSALIFEDFDTTGLQGDATAPYPPRDKSENNFFHFFRAEGLTDKDSSKRGSWGLGKDTFIRASRLNTMFGLTVRRDDRRCLLMGKTVLRSHHLGNDARYQDGYFGVLANTPSGFVIPIEDTNAIEEFCTAFNVERKAGESGLSIIVPWPHNEITEGAICRAVVDNCFYPILSNDLQVIVEMPGVDTILEKDTLPSQARKLTNNQRTLTLIPLAQWAVSDSVEEARYTIGMPDPDRAWAWSGDLFSDDLLKTLSEKLQNGENVALRVPVTLRKKDGTRPQSYFDVYLKSDDSNDSERPVFIRDGTMIADVKARPMRGVRAMVIVDEPALSEFLRKSENPSHTVWQAQQLKQDYVYAVGGVRFVIDSVSSIYNIVMAADKEEDRRLLADIFPKPGKGKQRTPPPPRPQYFSLSDLSGGFRVAQGQATVPEGSLMEIEAAYDTRRGNPLKKYTATDFRLERAPVTCEHEGIEIVEMSGNRILARVVDPQSFRVSVTGFDRNRQIYVRADRAE